MRPVKEGIWTIICVIPKKQHEAGDEATTLLNVVSKSNQQYKAKEVVKVLVGQVNALIKSHRTDDQDFFGIGADKEEAHWMALLRQMLVAGLLKKDIETYGVIKVTEAGEAFRKNPGSFMMAEDHSYREANDDTIVVAQKGGASADDNLFKLLKAERKKVADELELPPFVIFQDPSLERYVSKVSHNH